jgi:hypothetical protein
LPRRRSNYVRHARRIDFSGPESRVFKFPQPELFPQGCPKIVEFDDRKRRRRLRPQINLPGPRIVLALNLRYQNSKNESEKKKLI